MFSEALTLCEKISLHPGYHFQQRESWYKIISSFPAISFFFLFCLDSNLFPGVFVWFTNSLCISNSNISPKGLWMAFTWCWQCCHPWARVNHLLGRRQTKLLTEIPSTSFNFKKAINLFRRKRAILTGSRMPKPGHLIFYMLKTVFHANIDSAHQTSCEHTRRMCMFPYRVFIKMAHKNNWTTLSW